MKALLPLISKELVGEEYGFSESAPKSCDIDIYWFVFTKEGDEG